VRYFHRCHDAPEAVLAFADRFFSARGFATQAGQGDYARYAGPLGHVDLHVATEGGHGVSVEVATAAVGESEIDGRVKRFLAELRGLEEPGLRVRGAY